MTGKNNDYKKIWTNRNKQWKIHMLLFTISNLKGAITYKYGQVVLFLTSVYFVISKSILLFSYSFHVPCVIIPKVYFYIVRSMFAFPFNWPQSKASVVNQISHLFFEAQKYFFALFSFLKMVIFASFRRWSRSRNSTSKMTELFRHCLTLLISKLK